MDQGLLENVKRRYRKFLLFSILTDDDDTNNEGYIEKLEAVNIFNAIRLIAAAWNEVNTSKIIKSWRKFLNHKATISEDVNSERFSLVKNFRNVVML